MLANDGIAECHHPAWLRDNDLVMCALLVEHFRELRPPVSGEPKEEPPSMADFAMCTSPSSMSVSPYFWNDLNQRHFVSSGSGVCLLLDRNPFPVRVPAEFKKTVISGSWTNAMESALERDGLMAFGV